MKNAGFVLIALTLTALIVYLFVSAPPPLPEQAAANARHSRRPGFRTGRS